MAKLSEIYLATIWYCMSLYRKLDLSMTTAFWQACFITNLALIFLFLLTKCNFQAVLFTFLGLFSHFLSIAIGVKSFSWFFWHFGKIRKFKIAAVWISWRIYYGIWRHHLIFFYLNGNTFGRWRIPSPAPQSKIKTKASLNKVSPQQIFHWHPVIQNTIVGDSVSVETERDRTELTTGSDEPQAQNISLIAHMVPSLKYIRICYFSHPCAS